MGVDGGHTAIATWEKKFPLAFRKSWAEKTIVGNGNPTSLKEFMQCMNQKLQALESINQGPKEQSDGKTLDQEASKKATWKKSRFGGKFSKPTPMNSSPQASNNNNGAKPQGSKPSSASALQATTKK